MAAEELGAAAGTVTAPTAAEAADVETLLVCRVHLHTLFHKLFGGAPLAELLKELSGEETLSAVEAYAQDSQVMREVVEFLRTLGDGDARGLLDRARDEYTRLFIGPAELIAYPWESPYTNKQAAVCQESTIAVREAYRAQGLEPRKLLRVPDDHVSLMCAFMAELGGRALEAFLADDAAAAAKALRDQEAFVRRHMVGWLPEYARLARRSKTAVLYPQMIEACADFIALDAVFLSEAAFWLESLAEREDAALSELAASCADDADAPAREALRRATARLAGMRLAGIEDNELVAVAA